LTEEPELDLREPADRSACGPPVIGDGPRIVTVCAEELSNEVEPLGLMLGELNTGSLVTYSRTAELKLYPPVGEIALFVLAGGDSPELTGAMLQWLGRYWPGTATVVIGHTGCVRQELQARMGGAIYLVRPVPRRQWQSLVRLALRRAEATGMSAA